MKFLISFIVVFVCVITPTLARSKDEWKTRTIYQLLTDRFAKGDGSKGGCDLHNYCGGNYRGIISKLDYIQSLGFDAIWISPVVDNYDGGYHGYWARNMYEVNSRFGSKDDLKAFVNACHQKGIWVMVDVVGNHMGNTNTDFSKNYPFNDASHYHDYCIIQDSDFASHNMHNLQFCRLAGLADLNTESAYVQQEMNKWINWLVKEYQFDGIRIDTIVEVPTFFWKSFTQASGVFSIGEAFDGDQRFVAQFVGSVDSVLNYPQFFSIREVFLHSKDMTDIKNFYNNWSGIVGANNLQYLGNFNDNHDNARFLSGSVRSNLDSTVTERFLEYSSEIEASTKLTQFKAFTAFQLTSVGIPIIYYGTEQAFAGDNDPNNREVLWNNFNEDHEMYLFVQAINRARKSQNAAAQPQIERYADAELYAFSRGNLFAAFSSKLDRQVHKKITYHPYSEGQTICNIFYATDCIKVTGGAFDVYLNYGEVKIFTPK